MRKDLTRRMEEASEALEFEHAADYRDRLAALSHVQAHQGINPQHVAEADVFAAYQEAGQTCVQVFFFRNHQNWGARAYFPRADKSFSVEEVLESFIAQFYDGKQPPRLILLSHELPEQAVLAEALSLRAGRKVTVGAPRRGEKWQLVHHALVNAREALGRKLAETSTQARLLEGLGQGVRTWLSRQAGRGLRQQPHPGRQRGWRDDRRRPRGLRKKGIPQVQHSLDRPDARRRLRA